MFTKDCLNSFEAISLPELNRLNFDDRQDTKFVFHENLLPQLFESLSQQYRILDINGLRSFQYESLYLDTSELTFYDDHHRGKVKRHKFRFRKYLDSGTTHFEIKTRNNKRRSQKLRIQTDEIRTTLPPELKQAVHLVTQVDPESLQPSLSVALSRITLVQADASEKITFDLNVSFKMKGETKDLKELVIAEVKQNRYNPKSEFFRIQRHLRIYPSTVSKYCLGIALLNPNVKTNRFKEGIRELEKINAHPPAHFSSTAS